MCVWCGVCVVGVGDLSPSSENCFLACLSPQNAGDLLIFDANSLQAKHVIPAHKSPVTIVSFNENGTLLATASDKGTVIRVFSLPDGQVRYSFRRGSFPVTITSLSFSRESLYLTVSSDSDTVHIFKLGQVDEKSTSSMLGNYLPGVINEMLEPSRHFAHLKIPEKSYNICALNK